MCSRVSCGPDLKYLGIHIIGCSPQTLNLATACSGPSVVVQTPSLPACSLLVAQNALSLGFP